MLSRHPQPGAAGRERSAQAGHHHHRPHPQRPPVRPVQGVRRHQRRLAILQARPPQGEQGSPEL